MYWWLRIIQIVIIKTGFFVLKCTFRQRIIQIVAIFEVIKKIVSFSESRIIGNYDKNLSFNRLLKRV